MSPATSFASEVVSAVKQSFLLPEVWQMEDKETERKLVDTFRRCAQQSTANLSREQEDLNSENAGARKGGGSEREERGISTTATTSPKLSIITWCIVWMVYNKGGRIVSVVSCKSMSMLGQIMTILDNYGKIDCCEY